MSSKNKEIKKRKRHAGIDYSHHSRNSIQGEGHCRKYRGGIVGGKTKPQEYEKGEGSYQAPIYSF